MAYTHTTANIPINLLIYLFRIISSHAILAKITHTKTNGLYFGSGIFDINFLVMVGLGNNIFLHSYFLALVCFGVCFYGIRYIGICICKWNEIGNFGRMIRGWYNCTFFFLFLALVFYGFVSVIIDNVRCCGIGIFKYGYHFVLISSGIYLFKYLYHWHIMVWYYFGIDNCMALRCLASIYLALIFVCMYIFWHLYFLVFVAFIFVGINLFWY